jgi:hypothetical protein
MPAAVESIVQKAVEAAGTLRLYSFPFCLFYLLITGDYIYIFMSKIL